MVTKKAEMHSKKVEGLKRLPLVVIPKRRKNKDNRRRHHANLRKCSSDPQIYRSYNHWLDLQVGSKNLKKKDNDAKPKSSIIAFEPVKASKPSSKLTITSSVVAKENDLPKGSVKKLDGSTSALAKKTVLERKNSAAKRRKAEDLQQIKKELREAAKLPQLAKIPKPKESDDVRAKKTLNAVTAAFSNTDAVAQPPPPSVPQTSAIAKSSAKPPASPSLGGRKRFPNDNRLNVSTVQTNKLKAMPSEDVSKSSTSDVPILKPGTSTENPPKEENHAAQPASSNKRPVDPELLNRLKLDNSVLKKIDHIIAGGTKKTLATSTSQVFFV